MTTDNERIVQQALAGLVDAGDVDALAGFLGADFHHHRPDGTTRDRAEWLADVRAALAPIAGMKVEIVHLLSDEEHVVVHSRRALPGGPEVTVVDILRVEDGLITDIWETIEPAAHAPANLRWWETS